MSRHKNFDEERFNPCLKEQKLTYKCLDQHGYDKEKCQLETKNYNTCKGFWNHVRLERRRKGITPHLPLPEERDKIKADYFKQYSQNT